MHKVLQLIKMERSHVLTVIESIADIPYIYIFENVTTEAKAGSRFSCIIRDT